MIFEKRIETKRKKEEKENWKKTKRERIYLIEKQKNNERLSKSKKTRGNRR